MVSFKTYVYHLCTIKITIKLSVLSFYVNMYLNWIHLHEITGAPLINKYVNVMNIYMNQNLPIKNSYMTHRKK